MQHSYTKNYLKIYFWQALSIVLGFVSMFIVVPFLSSDQATYGIYTVCMSVTIFLSYADLGFLGAGQKYAAEAYARGEDRREAELIGFAHFVLLCVVLAMSLVFLYLSFHPEQLISGLDSEKQVTIAHRLLLILAIFSPTIVMQRMLQMIFGIRLREYNFQKINIGGNILKILSVFYFFGGENYDIVGYYLFLQLITVGTILGGIWSAKRTCGYDFRLLIRCFKFSKDIFRQTKSLAFASLFATLSWVLYYEFDAIAIGKILGSTAVAIYAIGLTVLSFFRSLLGVCFSPFSARFNHFIGMGQTADLKHFYGHILTIMFPVVIFPLTAVAIMAKGIVISWVGPAYEPSIPCFQWLVLCNVLGFVSYPAGMLLLAREKIGMMNIINTFLPVVFWVGVILTVGMLGVMSFALFKFIAFFLTGILYIYFSIQFLNWSFWIFVRQVVLPYLPALAVMIAVLLLLQGVCIDGKNKLNLLINLLIAGGGIVIGMTTAGATCGYFRQYIYSLVRKI